MMFKAIMLILSRAPPENILKRSSNVPWFCWNIFANLSGSIPGIGICVPILYMMTAIKTKRSLFHSSERPLFCPKAEGFTDMLDLY